MKSPVNLELIFPNRRRAFRLFHVLQGQLPPRRWHHHRKREAVGGRQSAFCLGRRHGRGRSWEGRIRLTALTASLFAGAFSVLQHSARNQSHSSIRSPSKNSVDDPTKRGANSLEPLPLVPSLSAARLVIVRSMNELEVRHPGRIPFVHDLSADYTPGDIALSDSREYVTA